MQQRVLLRSTGFACTSTCISLNPLYLRLFLNLYVLHNYTEPYL